jgi:hypothetical protein
MVVAEIQMNDSFIFLEDISPTSSDFLLYLLTLIVVDYLLYFFKGFWYWILFEPLF